MRTREEIVKKTLEYKYRSLPLLWKYINEITEGLYGAVSRGKDSYTWKEAKDLPVQDRKKDEYWRAIEQVLSAYRIRYRLSYQKDNSYERQIVVWVEF